jgi:hypothetical protein
MVVVTEDLVRVRTVYVDALDEDEAEVLAYDLAYAEASWAESVKHAEFRVSGVSSDEPAGGGAAFGTGDDPVA